MEEPEYRGFCPSCQDEHNEYNGPKLCNKCAERRDKRVEHTEEDIQEQMQKDIDNTIKRSWR